MKRQDWCFWANPVVGCRVRLAWLPAALGLLLAGCAGITGQGRDGGQLPACHIIYDAGSSATRLFVYQRTTSGWQGHRGPVTDALADPVRGIRGKTMQDAGAVVGDIVMALEDLRHDGPAGSTGEQEWPAFDWKKQCRIESAAVYATAGMRMAEQLRPQASSQLWHMLDQKLSAALQVDVTARTLTGYEEGLFAWLTKRQAEPDGNFGLAEMGGASMQVTFPCRDCEASRPVKVKGGTLPIYSQSLLGWGQDEAWKKYAHLPACQVGSGNFDPGWTAADCALGMEGYLAAIAGIAENIGPAGELRWYISAAFSYMQDTDVDDYCRQGIESSFQPDSACFRAVYLKNVLDTLGVNHSVEKSDVSWTLGAVVCTDTRCLKAE
ncbi:MAG: nucleoside phosphatase [Xanthomonadales bacterium]|nr:nucleoside phosphatase [Xanthomonadales bacterium]